MRAGIGKEGRLRAARPQERQRYRGITVAIFLGNRRCKWQLNYACCDDAECNDMNSKDGSLLAP